MEPQLRKLGLSTRMERGVPTIDVEHTVCREGETLNSEQVRAIPIRSPIRSIGAIHYSIPNFILLETLFPPLPWPPGFAPIWNANHANIISSPSC
jgi:hypothetical protein